MLTQITDSFAVKWPATNLALKEELGLASYDRSIITDFLKTFIPQRLAELNFPTQVNSGARFTYDNQEKVLEHTLIFFYDADKKITHLILSQKGFYSKGNERLVKKSYDLVMGKAVVDKFVYEKEKIILETLRGVEGISRTYGFYTCYNISKNENELHTIEKFYADGDLAACLRQGLFSDTKHKISIMHNLLSALNALCTHSWNHLDIKLENIFVKNFKGVLGDYGLANCLNESKGAPQYLPPEYFDFVREKKFDSPSPDELKAFNTKYGRARDVWALGLVFLCIIKNTYSEKDAILDFLNDAFRPALKRVNDIPTLFPKKVFHSNEALQNELKQLTNFIDDPSLLNALRLTGKMLKFDPKNRISASEAFEEIQRIKFDSI